MFRPPTICRRAGIILFAALVAACGGSLAPQEPAGGPVVVPLAAPGIWVVLGSSTAAGVGAAPGEGWVDLLEGWVQPRGVVVERLARPGLQTTQALPVGTPLPAGAAAPVPAVNIDAALARGPVLVLLSFPSNDAAMRVAAADTVGRWQQMAQRAAGGRAGTVVLGIQPRAAFDVDQREIVVAADRLASTTFGPCYVAVHDLLVAADGNLAARYRSSDGDHLNAAGHLLVFTRMTEVLESGRCVRLGTL